MLLLNVLGKGIGFFYCCGWGCRGRVRRVLISCIWLFIVLCLFGWVLWGLVEVGREVWWEVCVCGGGFRVRVGGVMGGIGVCVVLFIGLGDC